MRAMKTMKSFKKLILSVLVINAVLLAGRIWQEVHLARAVAPPVPAGNGDGDRDVSDAVYMLLWLFRNGPEPIALAGSPELEARVGSLEAHSQAVTGQIEGLNANFQGVTASIATILAEIEALSESRPSDPGAAAVAELERTVGESIPSALVSSLQLMERSPTGARNMVLGVEGAELLVIGFSGREEISRLFSFQLSLLSEGGDIDYARLVGTPAQLRFTHANSTALVDGIVKSIGPAGRVGRSIRYRMELVPKLWLLTRAADVRIFQGDTAPEILATILDEGDLASSAFFDLQRETYPSREYCVQYRETDFNFASRLMEEEGIYYFFKHTAAGHQMVLSDIPASHPDLPAVVPYSGHGAPPRVEGEERVITWQKEQELVSGKVTLWDHNFERPSEDLLVTAGKPESKFELYDYPGEYAQRFDGIATAEIRVQEEQAKSVVISGTSTCKSFRPGHKFTLVDHSESGFGGTYVLTSVQHLAVQTAGRETGTYYANSFTCIPDSVVFRPERRTPQPKVYGAQTAVVVGPAGEEIHTDQYGRVKVQFHWDRQGQKDEHSSAWIRVAQLHASSSIMIPRIGWEVLVDFLEGDPDRPIIIGSVYNREQLPPYALPGSKAVSAIGSDTTPGGGTNELRFDDTAGAEELLIHGSKDTRVVAEDTASVSAAESVTIATGANQILLDDTDGAELVVIASSRAAALSAPDVSIDSPRTEVRGSLVSETNADPLSAVKPGERHRDNAIVAWARVNPNGTIAGEFGVRGVERFGFGHYRVTVDAAAARDLDLIPVVTPEVGAQPQHMRDLRFASVSRVGVDAFDIFINSTETPADGAFIFMATAR